MKPILFESSATDFTTNGIGRLTDTISAIATSESNGIYDLQLEYPVIGVLYEQIVEDNIIVVDTSPKQKKQAFRIVKITKPINGIVIVLANHISYDQSYIPVTPFIAKGITETLSELKDNAIEDNIFTFTTDLENETSTFNLNVPASLRSCIGGMEGSILDVFSGSGGIELLFDNFNTFITLHRGEDNGVELRYAKNITDLNQQKSIENTITGVLPYWANEEENLIFIGDVAYSPNVDKYANHRTVVLDLSAEFETAPSTIELNQAAQNYVNRASVGVANTNIKVSFINRADAEKFEDISVLEQVELFDIVKVYYPPLNISYSAKIIKCEWDCLKERYNNVEIGDPRSNMASTIADNLGDISSLKLSNNKLVSITQSLNREIGEVQTTVGTLTTKVNDDLSARLTIAETNITQNSNNITLRATKTEVDSSIDELTNGLNETNKEVAKIGTALIVNPDSVIIQQQENGYLELLGNAVNVIVDGNQSASFADESVKAKKYTVDDVWHQDTVNDGFTWVLSYKNERSNS